MFTLVLIFGEMIQFDIIFCSYWGWFETRLGSTYVKLGQFIASSPTVFPAEYVKEFQACLDSTSTVSFVEVKRIIEGELGRPLRTRGGGTTIRTGQVNILKSGP